MAALVHVRLSLEDVRQFERRLERLIADFRASEARDGEPFGFVVGFNPVGRGDA